MEIVVITKNGFMTSKEPKDVLGTDTVMYEGTPKECNNFIHSIPNK
jgi:hypothetical protein